MPCAVCGKPGPSEAAHGPVAGMGMKGDDMEALPLCARCHRTGAMSMHQLGSWELFGEVWEIDPDEKRRDLRERFRRAK